MQWVGMFELEIQNLNSIPPIHHLPFVVEHIPKTHLFTEKHYIDQIPHKINMKI
jgi:hypothetical protein